MLIEKLNNSQVEKETAGYIKLFKNKTTGELMYLTKDNREVVFPTEDKVLQLITDNIPSSDYTETIITITPTETTYSDGRPLVESGILAMGSSPIELLPAPGVGKYYDIDKVIIEYTHVTTGYTFTDEIVLQINSNTRFIKQILGGSNTWLVISDLNGTEGVVSAVVGADIVPAYGELTNKGLTLSTYNGTDPTLGNGTLRVKIYHKTITFGA